MKETTQTRIRFHLPPNTSMRPIDRKLAECHLNQTPLPTGCPARNFILTRVLRESCKTAMRQISECPPAMIGFAVEHARTVKEIASAALASHTLDPLEGERTERQLAHPSSLEDWIIALDETIKHHRAPVWFSPIADQLDRIEHGLQLLAGHVAAKGQIGGAYDL